MRRADRTRRMRKARPREEGAAPRRRSASASRQAHQLVQNAVVLAVALAFEIVTGWTALMELDGVTGLVHDDRHRPLQAVLSTDVDAGAAALAGAVPEAAAAEAAA